MNLFFYLVKTNNMKIILIILLLITKVNAKEINYLESLTIENYEINFNKNVYEYEITINDEKNLNIDYTLSDNSVYASIEGNGNFNKTHNIITININNTHYYKIHVYKTIQVSKIEETEEIKEMSPLKKEIVKIIIITISSSLIFGFYYITFINQKVIGI